MVIEEDFRPSAFNETERLVIEANPASFNTVYGLIERNANRIQSNTREEGGSFLAQNKAELDN